MAVTALARKLIVLVWHLLTNEEPYRYTQAKTARRKLKKATPPDQKKHAYRIPQSLEAVYEEAGLPTILPPSQAERRVAAINRRARTRISNSFKSTE